MVRDTVLGERCPALRSSALCRQGRRGTCGRLASRTGRPNGVVLPNAASMRISVVVDAPYVSGPADPMRPAGVGMAVSATRR